MFHKHGILFDYEIWMNFGLRNQLLYIFLSFLFFYDLLIDFNGISTRLKLFPAKKLRNHIHCTFIVTFLRGFFL